MSLDDDVATLAKVPMLNVLGRQTLRMVAVGAETRDLAEGDILFPPDAKADCAYVIQSGVFKVGPDAERARDGFEAGPGDMLGEFALLSETAQPLTAVALEPSTVMRISRSMFLKILETDGEAALRLRNYVAKRAQAAVSDALSVHTLLASKQD
jgi:CRP-like cAMP-binding protein